MVGVLRAGFGGCVAGAWGDVRGGLAVVDEMPEAPLRGAGSDGAGLARRLRRAAVI
jgi:hypothetical protein